MSDLQPFSQNIDNISISSSPIDSNSNSTDIPIFNPPTILPPLQHPINQPAETVNCRSCSAEQLNPTAKFCANCGASFIVPSLAPTNNSSSSPDPIAIASNNINKLNEEIKNSTAVIPNSSVNNQTSAGKDSTKINEPSNNSNTKKRPASSTDSSTKPLIIKCKFCSKQFVNELNMQRHQSKFHTQLNSHYNQYGTIPVKLVENNNNSAHSNSNSGQNNTTSEISSLIARSTSKRITESIAKVPASTSISSNKSIHINVVSSDSDSDSDSDRANNSSDSSSESNYEPDNINNSEDENSSPNDSELSNDLDDIRTPARKKLKLTDSENSVKSSSKKRHTAFTQLVNDEFINSVAGGFIEWLGKVSSNIFELTVKAKRITTENQIIPIKSNLKFIFSLFIEQNSTDISSFTMEEFTKLETCQKVYQALLKRGVKASRIHSIFLLIKKVLVYLASTQSQITIVSPHSLPSYIFVEQLCHEASSIRKTESANRHLLYFDATNNHSNNSISSNLIQQNQLSFRQPQQQQNSIDNIPNPLADFNIRPIHQNQGRVNNQYTSALSSNNIVPSVPTQQDLSKLTKKALEYLDKQRLSNISNPKKNSITSAQKFAIYLCTVSFVLLTGPRTQVISNLIINHTFVWENNGYKIKMPGEMIKSRKPILLSVPENLTALYTFYLKTIRPLLLKQPPANNAIESKSTEAVDCGYVFLNKSGTGKKSNFGLWVSICTIELLGRSFTPHSFRSAIITTFYGNGANQMELYQLSKIMSHDQSTQRNYYVKSDYQKSLVSAQDRMNVMLGLDR